MFSTRFGGAFHTKFIYNDGKCGTVGFVAKQHGSLGLSVAVLGKVFEWGRLREATRLRENVHGLVDFKENGVVSDLWLQSALVVKFVGDEMKYQRRRFDECREYVINSCRRE